QIGANAENIFLNYRSRWRAVSGSVIHGRFWIVERPIFHHKLSGRPLAKPGSSGWSAQTFPGEPGPGGRALIFSQEDVCLRNVRCAEAQLFFLVTRIKCNRRARIRVKDD